MRLSALGAICLVATLSTTVGAQDHPDASGPPSNLRGGKFQKVVDAMWNDSPTFREQCRRLATAPRLTVTITADVMRPPSFARAATSMVRDRGVLITADIVLHTLADRFELIAHEIEHIVEQLEGVVLDRNECQASTSPSGFYESCRAVRAGQRVAREVYKAKARRGRNGSARVSGNES